MLYMKHVIDLTHHINTHMPSYPGDTPAQLRQTNSLTENGYVDYQLTTGMHLGTHIDGPAHLTENNVLLSTFPACYFIGQGVLIDARDKTIDATLLHEKTIKPDSIVLVLTGHGEKFGSQDYYVNHPTIQPDFAQALISSKVNMLGFDLPSPDTYPFALHKMLLTRNILLIENLTNLELLLDVPNFTLAALPLKTETDSAPARVIAFY